MAVKHDYVKDEKQAEIIWKQNPTTNIWPQKKWEWGLEKDSHWETAQLVPFTQYTQSN